MLQSQLRQKQGALNSRDAQLASVQAVSTLRLHALHKMRTSWPSRVSRALTVGRRSALIVALRIVRWFTLVTKSGVTPSDALRSVFRKGDKIHQARKSLAESLTDRVTGGQ